MDLLHQQVFLPAIAGHVPDGMVRAISAFIDFYYLVRRAVITEDTLIAIDAALVRFHHEREIFRDTGIRNNFNLPRQHSMNHYRLLIQMFGAPNGLCSSITENKHITAVKEPWRRSNRYEALGQMLVTNQRLDKLAAARVDFTTRGMMDGPCLPNIRPLEILPSRTQPEPQPTAPSLLAYPPEPVNLPEWNDDEESDETAAEGPKSLGEVRLSRGSGMYFIRGF
jgi:hypothetical protein